MFMIDFYKSYFSYPFRRRMSRYLFLIDRNRTVYREYIYEKGVLFIHIPKSAGKSLALAVYGNDKPGHYFAEDYKWCDEVAFEKFFKFCFVRHPISRFISAYEFLNSGGTAQGDYEFKNRVLDKYSDINDFVENWVCSKNILKKEHFIPQCFYTHVNGESVMDFVGRYESIDEDYKYIMGQVKGLPELPFVNKGERVGSILNDRSEAKLRQVYAEDFRIFGYD